VTLEDGQTERSGEGNSPGESSEEKTRGHWDKAWQFVSWSDYQAGITFLIVVGRLFLASGLDSDVLLLFLLPPIMALLAVKTSDRESTRLVGNIFLSLIALGVMIAPFEGVFPELGQQGQVSNDLPAETGRIVSWYLCVYLLWLFNVLPLLLFIRGLRDRRDAREGGFSAFTCYLGLFAWLMVGPLMIALIVKFLWPIV